MSFHDVLVWIPAPLAAFAALADALELSRPGETPGRPGRLLVGTTVAVLLVTAFTGLGARRRFPASVPGSPMAPWDVHANLAVVLLVPVLVLGFFRVRAVGAPAREKPGRLVLLDLGILVLVSVIVASGLRIP